MQTPHIPTDVRAAVVALEEFVAHQSRLLHDRLTPDGQALLKEAQKRLGFLVCLLGEEPKSDAHFYEMRLHYQRWENLAAHYLGASLDDLGNAYAGTPDAVAAKLGNDPWGIATFLPGDPDWERLLRWRAPECPEEQHRLLAPDQASDLLKPGGALRFDLIRIPLWGAFNGSTWWRYSWLREGSSTLGHVLHEDLVAAFKNTQSAGDTDPKYEADYEELLRAFRDPASRERAMQFILDTCSVEQVGKLLEFTVAQSGETEGAYDLSRVLLLRTLEEVRAESPGPAGVG